MLSPKLSPLPSQPADTYTSPMSRHVLLTLFTLLLFPLGCAENAAPDTHTEVFKTPDEVLAAPRAHQVKSWKTTAIEVLREERPDLSAEPDEGAAIILTGEGVRERIDLNPIAADLTAQPDIAHSILRQYLLKYILPFDQ